MVNHLMMGHPNFVEPNGDQVQQISVIWFGLHGSLKGSYFLVEKVKNAALRQEDTSF